MNDSPIFVVGCSRSGTTLLRDLLRSHPRLSFPPETHFIPQAYRSWGDPKSARDARALGARIMRLATVRRWQIELEPTRFERCRSFAEILDVLYGEFARREGRSRWGDKTPHQVTELPTLMAIFPGAKLIHIYRDGRDVALSWVRRRFGPQNLYGAAVAWRRLVATGRRDGEHLSDSYMEVRYEALLDTPEEVMRAVCDFIGESFCPDVLRPAERTEMYAWRKRARGEFYERPEIESDNQGHWRTLMPVSDRALFESIAGRLLAELGYEVEGLSHPLPRHLRAWWTADNEIRMALSRARLRELSPRDFASTRVPRLSRALARVRF